MSDYSNLRVKYRKTSYLTPDFQNYGYQHVCSRHFVVLSTN